MIPNDLPVLADACPVCDPGTADAAPPIGSVAEVNGGRLTDHQCPGCATARAGEIDLIVAKNRHGALGTATLAFRGHHAMCDEMYSPEQDELQAPGRVA